MTDITQPLPLELWGEILGHASAPDILRFKEVNRVFRDAIVTSPLIQHKIDLFATGLEYNAAAGVGLADSRKALLQYRSNLDTLHATEERMMDRPVHWSGVDSFTTVGGIYAIAQGSSLRLFTLGSTSRGMPYEEWEIPLPTVSYNLAGYAFDRAADAIAFVGQPLDGSSRIEIYLRTLSDGRHHPAARMPNISYSRGRGWPIYIFSVSMTSSRLAVLVETNMEMYLIVMDWMDARVVYQDDGSLALGSIEFVDDFRLLIGRGSMLVKNPQFSLLLVDTRNTIETGHTETSFELPFGSFDIKRMPLHTTFIMERGVHKPSFAESLAPFRLDPTQRIVALRNRDQSYLVFRVGVLLELAERNKRPLIGWKEWKKHVLVTLIEEGDHRELSDVQVAGCRLFAVYLTRSAMAFEVEVFDFSMRGRMNYLVEQEIRVPDVGRFLRPTGAVRQIPWRKVFGLRGGHESIVFFHTVWEGGREEYVLHIWTF